MVITLTSHNFWTSVFHSEKWISRPHAIVIISYMCSPCEMLPTLSPASLIPTYLLLISIILSLLLLLFQVLLLIRSFPTLNKEKIICHSLGFTKYLYGFVTVFITLLVFVLYTYIYKSLLPYNIHALGETYSCLVHLRVV